MRRVVLLFLPLLLVSIAGAAPSAPRPLHHKSDSGLMRPAYLATSAEAAQMLTDMPANSSVLQPAAVLQLAAPARAAASAPGLLGVGTDSAMLRLGWSSGLTITQSLPASTGPAFLAAGDLNGDSQVDLATIAPSTSNLAVAQGNAGGTLDLPLQHAIPANVEALLAADLNGDCRDDTAFTSTNGIVQVLPQFPNGALGLPLVAPFPNSGATDLAAGDLNHDGQLDLAALRGDGGVAQQVSLYYMQGDRLNIAGQRTVEDGGFAAHAVAIGDVTGDGRADLVVGAGGNVPDAFINIFVQGANGVLATIPITLTAWHLPEAVAVADLNHDGRNDVIALNSGWLALSLYLGQADGTLAPYETYPLPYSAAYRPETLAVADINGDGGLDVLIADGDRGVTYLLNNSAAPTATITTPTPCAVGQATMLVLNGTIANGTELEVSLDGGGTWSAATVNDSIWSYTTPLTSGVYPVVLARARAGARVQAPPAELLLRSASHQTLVYLPLVRN